MSDSLRREVASGKMSWAQAAEQAHERANRWKNFEVVLETALEWQGCSITLFTDDIPYEDMLRIYMFGANMTLVDSAVLGSRYSNGTFAELNLLPSNSLTFRFFGGTVWRLILLDNRSLPCPSFPTLAV